jgi:hypothetical protein
MCHWWYTVYVQRRECLRSFMILKGYMLRLQLPSQLNNSGMGLSIYLCICLLVLDCNSSLKG